METEETRFLDTAYGCLLLIEGADKETAAKTIQEAMEIAYQRGLREASIAAFA